MNRPIEMAGSAPRTASRYVALGMGLVGLAGIALAVTLFLLDRQEHATRADLETFHLRSISLLGDLSGNLAEIRRGISAIEAPEDEYAAGRRELRLAVAAAGVAIEKLEVLLPERRGPLTAGILQTIGVRYERFVPLLDRDGRKEGVRGADADAVNVAFDSLSLAVEQLRRLEEIDAKAHLDEIAIGSAQRNRALVLIGVLFVAVGLSIVLVLALLKRALAREGELLASLESERSRRERASKTEALGRLAGGVAHDFNNLLTVIAVHSEVVHQSLDSENPLREETESILLASDQAAALTRQLLMLSRTRPSEPRVIDLNELTRGMETILRGLLGGLHTLATHLAPDLGAVRVDPREMERVLVNLVSNAGDAMPKGGLVAIETTNARGKQGDAEGPEPDSDTQDFVRLSVCDTGTGMDLETLAQVLDPFFTTKAEGTGLGLSTADGLIAKAGGWIDFESELGIGTRVDVYLPRHEGDGEDDIQLEPPAGSSMSGTILLVDDEPAVRRSFVRTLREAGARPAAANCLRRTRFGETVSD